MVAWRFVDYFPHRVICIARYIRRPPRLGYFRELTDAALQRVHALHAPGQARRPLHAD